jgi:hypothetical protein
VSVVDPSGALLEDLGSQQGKTFTWAKTDFAAGTVVEIKVQDSKRRKRGIDTIYCPAEW